MMASKLVRPHAQEKSTRINRWFNSGLDRVARGYSGALTRLVGVRPRRIVAGVVLTMLACLAAIYGLARFVPSELAPAEDRGAFFVSIVGPRSEEHTSELQSLMRISYAVFCLKKKKDTQERYTNEN